ncbi:MAG TPA: flagellar motor stator protein MotA [Alphaproteobacteria bacterium]|nr:flagellar motor stator protein MotA [Alphaproteobacteria bacterium]
MLPLIGLGIVLASVFGVYLFTGGSMEIILKALPKEIGIIGGAAVGAFLIANGSDVVRHLGHDMRRLLRGPAYGRAHYEQLLALTYELVRTMKAKGSIALEPHIEAPESSDIFARYPLIRDDAFTSALICDHLRLVSLGTTDPHQMEAWLERDIDKRRDEQGHGAHALQTAADGLPALGIVAAVLGVIKTMAEIDQPPAVLGGLIGAALVGTFLGVLLAYGAVSPVAARLKAIAEEESQFHRTFMAALVAYLQQHPPMVAAEVGRKAVPTRFMPSFAELEERLAAA